MNVMLVDDHPLFLEGLGNLMASRGFTVVGKARDGIDAVEMARRLRPDLILMDIQMPRLDGLKAVRMIKTELPDTRVVMLTMSEDDEDLFEALKNGACGYVLKTQDADVFFSLLSEAARGEAVLSPGLTTRIVREFARRPASENGPLPNLTSRQLQVLTLVAKGHTYREVGERLFLSERTIKYHMGEILTHLHMENRAQAIAFAKSSGLA